MLNRNELTSYAMDFTSFLIANTDDIDKIILYGSVARGDFNKNSDIDILIDTKNKKSENRINIIEDKFYKTENYKKWKLKGLENDLSIIVGKLDSEEWQDLKRAIINIGILLYGKYSSNIKKSNHYSIFVFENIKPDSKRISIHRKFFGFKINKKKYIGLIEKFDGTRLGKSSIIIKTEHAKKIKDLFKSKKITPKIYDVFSDSKI